MQYVANVSFGDVTAGEFLELDPILWQPEIMAGWLSPCDDQGRRKVSSFDVEQVALDSYRQLVDREDRASVPSDEEEDTRSAPPFGSQQDPD